MSEQLDQFMAAIRQVESGNRYNITGTDHGSKYGVARGAYQIMSGIWPGWAKEAGLGGADWRDPAAQDAVARHKMSYYYRKYGDWRLVAAAWFGGEGAANAVRDKGTSGARDGFGTSVPEYIQRVVNQMGEPSGNAPSGTDGWMAAANVGSAASPEVAQEAQAQDMRFTYAQVLDSMSQKIASTPERFEQMYATTTEPGDGFDAPVAANNPEYQQQVKSVTSGDRKVR